jgi:hypothetical protein
MKKFFVLIFAVILLTGGYWGVAKAVRQIGNYLIVYEKFENVEYLISNGLSPKAIEYFQSGKVKNILVTVAGSPEGNWKAFYRHNADLKIRNEARKFGIPQERVLIYKRRLAGEIDRVFFYKHLLKSLKAKSVLFIDPFYRTRTRRFFLDRYFEGLNIKTYVQYEKNIDSKELDQWWKKTTYANLFLDQYLLMSYYYLNKLLWTRAV